MSDLAFAFSAPQAAPVSPAVRHSTSTSYLHESSQGTASSVTAVVALSLLLSRRVARRVALYARPSRDGLDEERCNRRNVLVLPGLGLANSFQQFAFAEEAPLAETATAKAVDEFKVAKSALGNIEVQIPSNWSVKTDIENDNEKLVFAYNFLNRNLKDYAFLRVEQLSLEKFLKRASYVPSDSDKVSSSWPEIMNGSDPPLTATKFATMLIRASLPGSNQIYETPAALDRWLATPESKEGDAKDAPEFDSCIVDAQIAGNTGSEPAGSVLTFHVKTVVSREGKTYTGIQPVNRWFSGKAILSKGIVKAAYLSTSEKHWLPGYNSAYNGAFFDRMISSFRVLDA